MAAQEYINLARTLPPRLLRFFARYPPPPSAAFSNHVPSSSDTNTTPISATPPSTNPSSQSYTNPFSRTKNPITGNWHDPKYSLRRQAELVKLARANGVEDLLPPTVKGTEEILRRRMESGSRVKGTGVGQRVKGKSWERTQKGRLEKRRVAMLGMPKLVQTWKQLGHGRGWKKWPR